MSPAPDLVASERRLGRRAAAAAALGAAGGAAAAAAADALFLAHLGAGSLGLALAVSSLLVAAVLAVVGGLADRVDRRDLLVGAAGVAALGALGLAALAAATPAGAGAVGLVLTKQLQAALDLGLWVVVADRLDARQARRWVPRLAAAQGLGAAGGALLAVVAAPLGMPALLLGAAGCYVAAAAVAAGLEGGRRVANPPAAPRPWRLGAAEVRRSPLALALAAVVAIAGAFGALAFFALGSAAAAEAADAPALARLLGGVRAAVQLATLVAQLAIAPRLLDRVGVGAALVIAPTGAAVAAVAFELSGALAAAVALQAQARLLDAAVQSPAEKLALGLVPGELRGRVAGFVDGVAKRAGAVAGGLLALALAGRPHALGVGIAAVALAWLAVADRLRRRLPALAVDLLASPGPVAADAEALGALGGARTAAVAEAALAGPAADRAADVLVRLHLHRRVDATPALAAALLACEPAASARFAEPLLACAERGAARDPGRGGRLLAWAATHPRAPGAEAAVRAAALLGAPPPVAGWDGDGPLWHAARIGAARVSGAPDVGDLLDDAHDAAAAADGEAAAALRRLALREARTELVRRLAALEPRAATPAALDAATDHARCVLRSLRALRLRPGADAADVAVAAHALDALAELAAAAEPRPGAAWLVVRGDLRPLARRLADRRPDVERRPAPAAVAAAAIRVLGALPPAAADELRALVHALGDRDDEVAGAAEDALRALGPGATAELVAAAGYGRRAGRDRALALLRELPVTDAALAGLVDAELAALDHTLLRLGAVSAEPALVRGAVARRLAERAREQGYSALLLLAARHRAARDVLGVAARRWRQADAPADRARAVEIVDAALPRAVAVRVAAALDDGEAAARAAAAAARLAVEPPPVDAAVAAELTGGDPLCRALLLHALGPAGRARHRAAIAAAAEEAARELSPLALLRRLAATDEPATDAPAPAPRATTPEVPSSVETLLLLGEVPLLAGLSTRQLAELAEAVRWEELRPGDVAVAAGERLDALVVVAHGALVIGEGAAARRLGPGAAVDELAVVAPRPTPAAAVAAEPTRLARLARIDFEQLVDEVPGLASAVCRTLGERARGG